MFHKILMCLSAMLISVIFSSPTMASPYTAGNALSFNTSKWDSIPNSPTLSPSMLTFECWAKFNPSFENLGYHFLIDTNGIDYFQGGNYGTNGYYRFLEYHYSPNDNITGLLFEIRDHNADLTSPKSYVDCDSIKILSDLWYHFAGTYDGNWMRLYVNGNLISQKEVGAIVLGNDRPLKIGMMYGEMDEVRIWSVARTQDEIRSTMHGEIDSAPGLVSAWHFDEGSGQAVLDATGVNNGYLGSTPDSDINDPQWVQSTAPVTKDLFMLYPNGGEELATGSVQAIRWFAINTTLINIDYSSDAGITWNSVASQVDASLGSYSWKVPGEPSSLGLIRISDSSNPEHADMSDSLFIISIPYVRLLSPNGGEKWETQTVHNITWKLPLGIDKITIDYSTDNASNWIPVISQVNALADSFVWKVPYTPTLQGRVRIRSADSTLISVSANLFTIEKSSIVLLHPKGGEILEPGTVEDFTWSATPGVDSVRVEYSPDGGSSWSLFTLTDASSIFYRWNVPSKEISQNRIRVSWIAHPDVLADVSFSIRNQAPFPWTYYPSTSPVKLLSINGDAVWYVTDTNIWRLNRKTSVIDKIVPPAGVLGNVVAMAFDSKGTAWFGIKGVFIWSFDGLSWKNYLVQNLTGLGIDSKDVKFVTTETVDHSSYSLLSFNGIVWKTIFSDTYLPYATSHYMSILGIDNSRNSVWIRNLTGPEEIFKDTGLTGINGGTYDSWSSNPLQGFLDVYGNFWFASSTGYISTFTNGNWIHFSSLNSPIPWKADISGNYGITITPNNVKWFGGPGGLVRYGGNWETIPVNADSMKNSIWYLKSDADGNIWGITPDGIARYGYILPGPTSVDEKSDEPVAFGNITNYPNPFNPSTTIEFTLLSSGKANLVIYDIMGRNIRELVSGQVSAGMRMVRWDGRDDSGRPVSSGVYIAKLAIGKFAVVKKMLLMK